MPGAWRQTPRHTSSHPLLQHRSSILSVFRLLFLAVFNLPALQAAPLESWGSIGELEGPSPKDPEDAALWIYLAVAIALVLAGGAFAGLTIALMGQDEIYLQVIQSSGEGSERKNAARVLRLLNKGKHWVLVTLLLSNVITNETLPIVLDRSLGGGWPAVLGSTVLIVIFGEIIPQSICVRHGLPIGAWMSGPVQVLMYILAPVAYPTAKLLDRLLGEDHGTVYKKAGLKTLVTLHKTLGDAGEQLNSDEVTIISAVLDLKDKAVGSIMTPMDDVFTMSADTVLDENTMDIILSAGYSRIPIHTPDNPLNFVGMLLVKILITYDPEDCKQVRDFALATLPETRPETSCLDIVNYFQEGKSHMVLVTDFPGDDCGAAGVVTLEDVIEELIGEEIIDESDVFVDVHKAIRRMAPAPRMRVAKGQFVTDIVSNDGDPEERLIQLDGHGDGPKVEALMRVSNDIPHRPRKSSGGDFSQSPRTTFTLRRAASATGKGESEYITKRSDAPEVRDQLKFLGPSNLASRPRTTRYASVKIKQNQGKAHDAADAAAPLELVPRNIPVTHPPPSAGGGAGEGLLGSAGRDAKDGVMALQQGFGAGGIAGPSSDRHLQLPTANKGVQATEGGKGHVDSPARSHKGSRHQSRQHSRTQSTSTLGSLRSNDSSRQLTSLRATRSGSITENIVESGGFKKVVLELSSSSEEGVKAQASHARQPSGGGGAAKRKKKKKKKGGRAEEGEGGSRDESTPLLDR